MAINDRAEKLFRAIQDDPARTGFETHIGTGVSIPAGQVKCFKKPNGEIGLIIPAREPEYRTFKPDTKSQAIHLTKLKSRESDLTSLFEARLTLRDPAQRPVFFFFVDRILAHLDESTDATVADVSALLAKWRRFFSSSTKGDFSLTSEVGLLCELHLLLELLNARVPGALERWVGPENSTHDFEFPDFSIECKASTSMESLAVSIHGERQLRRVGDKPLYLEFRRYQLDPDGPISVPSIVEDLLLQDKVNPEMLISKVRAVGCDPFVIDAESHFNHFSAIDQYHFEVTEEFPHVEVKNDDQRISNLRFTIDLAGPMSICGYIPRLPFLD